MEAKRHVFQSAGELVEEAMREFVAPEKPNICKPKNLSRSARFPSLRERMRLPLDTGRLEAYTGYWFEASLQPEIGYLQLHSAVAYASVPASEPHPTNIWTAS